MIAAEGEHKASRSLRLAAEVIADSPAALQVRVVSVFVFVLYLYLLSRCDWLLLSSHWIGLLKGIVHDLFSFKSNILDRSEVLFGGVHKVQNSNCLGFDFFPGVSTRGTHVTSTQLEGTDCIHCKSNLHGNHFGARDPSNQHQLYGTSLLSKILDLNDRISVNNPYWDGID